MAAPTSIRYRPRMGRPRSHAERALQWVWRWRIELMLAYIVIAVSVVAITWK